MLKHNTGENYIAMR